MLSKFEDRQSAPGSAVWAGIYQNLKNAVHWHKEAEIIYLKSGTATVGVGRKNYRLEPGQLIYCSSGTLHFIDAAADSIAYLVIFHPSAVPCALEYAPQCPLVCSPGKFELVFLQLKQELKKKPLFYQSRASALITLYLSGLFRSLPLARLDDSQKNTPLAMYKSLLDYIQVHYATITFEEAANRMYFAPSYFSKIFSALSGVTFTQYVNHVRIQKAIELIQNSEKTITEIATRCGFNSVRHFNRMFKSITGTTPTQLPPGYTCPPMKGIARTSFDPTDHSSTLLESEYC